MIRSRTYKENYISYLAFEIALTFVLTFVAAGIVVFYSAGKSDARHHGHQLDYFSDNFPVYAFLCAAPALIAVAVILRNRNRNYIVGYAFDDNRKELSLLVRKLKAASLRTLTVGYTELKTEAFTEKKVFFNERYHGLSLVTSSGKLDLVRNNFIWEKQPRERIAFLDKIAEIEEQQ